MGARHQGQAVLAVASQAGTLRGESSRPLVLVLEADMGAGHRQVGGELVRRLANLGVRAREVDIGELLPDGLGRGLTGLYKFMACRAQWLYEATFRGQMRSRPGATPVLFPLDVLAEGRLASLVERERPALLLSTFHLSSQIAGRMRQAGKLPVPVVSLVLDFYVHGMWAHPGVDAHLLLHRSQVGQLRERGGRRPFVCGPVVRPCFDLASPSWERGAARSSLGLSPEDLCVLIVGGSWGVGDLTETYRVVAADGRFFPVAVAGHNLELERSLRRAKGGWSGRQAGEVLGWVDDMDRLMAAADVAVENAGGLTAMEAMARGVPVVTYAPIAGHGRANAAAMARAGVSLYPRGPAELISSLHSVACDSPERRRLVAEGRSMFSCDPARLVAAWALAGSVEAGELPAGKVPAPGCQGGQSPSGGRTPPVARVPLPGPSSGPPGCLLAAPALPLARACPAPAVSLLAGAATGALGPGVLQRGPDGSRASLVAGSIVVGGATSAPGLKASSASGASLLGWWPRRPVGCAQPKSQLGGPPRPL